jgi:hypothetical protein
MIPLHFRERADLELLPWPFTIIKEISFALFGKKIGFYRFWRGRQKPA